MRYRGSVLASPANRAKASRKPLNRANEPTKTRTYNNTEQLRPKKRVNKAIKRECDVNNAGAVEQNLLLPSVC